MKAKLNVSGPPSIVTLKCKSCGAQHSADLSPGEALPAWLLAVPQSQLIMPDPELINNLQLDKATILVP